MASDGAVGKEALVPPAVTALKHGAATESPSSRVRMERSFSQDIQEGSRELKEAAEQTRNIILDLGLDGVIRWASPSWTDVVGTKLEAVKGNPISKFIVDKPEAFTEAIKSLKNDDSKSQFVKFAIKVGVTSGLEPMLTMEQKAEAEGDKSILELEGQGIMVYDRNSGGESHVCRARLFPPQSGPLTLLQTMWMLQPAAEPVQITIALPRFLVESLGVGAELLAKYLTELAESGANDPAHHPPPLPVLCRVCERTIVPWWFEKHSDLCVQEHRAEMDVQMAQESLVEHRHAIVKVLDAFEARKLQHTNGESSPTNGPPPEYKGIPIGPASSPSSGMSSAPTSQPGTPLRSRSPSGAAGLSHSRGKSFAVRRPLARIVELILDLCDTAIEISIPAIKETKNEPGEEFRTQSPQSESRMSQILQWQTPSSLENEQGLAVLSGDTERMAKAKIEAVHRHRTIIEYAERIRQEYLAEVDACISEALTKAERVAAGEELSSSSESESEIENPPLPESEEHRAALPAAPATVPSAQSTVEPPSMATASKGSSEAPPHVPSLSRRSSSIAVSTRSSSPLECPTPRSHRSGLLGHPQPTTMRSSMYLENDANDSDSSSLLSSGILGAWRTESPSSEHALNRTASSRDRKRRSLHLHGLSSGSPRRQSPGRGPPAPPSPLRISKPRVPSAEGAHSPIISPLLTTGEFMSPHVHSHHHRRQSSVHSSDPRPPLSPKMVSISQLPQRVQPPSIKDFEIIKPISKGAFGSVYLSKKKLTGEYFAIKVLRKADMVAKNQVTNVKAERAIMMWQGESDFVAKLYWTFSSKDYLYLVMEYLNGGDCASLIKILGGLPEDWSKKYLAEVILGVEHLHSRGIVHRDLKPDNLLIDSKGHLKLTDFGLSRMGLVGRQKRVLKDSGDPAPDLLKQGPFVRAQSTGTSRSASFDYQSSHSPTQTPLMTPALAGGLDQPSYFSLSRENTLSRHPSRKTSGHRSDSGSVTSHELHHAFRSFSIYDPGDMHTLPNPTRSGPIEEESYSHGSNSPDFYPLQPIMSNVSQAPTGPTPSMLPPPMALFDPEDSTRRFVGTPDYLAPETINGLGQDEMSDWWSIGCILFEFLFGYPPFNADSPEKVFENILARKIAWPADSDLPVSEEARDLVNKLIQLDPRARIGANTNEKYLSSAEEIKHHPWFSDINWTTLFEDEAQFVPNPENPEDTEYFDARGATLQSFPEELEEQLSPRMTPGGTEISERPHDALGRVRSQVNTLKRGLMPLHIPPHVARDSRSRRLSEPAIADDFGNFTYKNLPILEKANKDIVNKMRVEAMQAQARGSTSAAVTTSNTPVTSSPGPSLEGSPLLPGPLKRTLSMNKGFRSASPSGPPGLSSSPSRPSQPSSPLLVQFSTGHNHERRKTSGSSQSSGSLQPGSFFDLPRDTNTKVPSAASSPIKNMRLPAISPAKVPTVQRQSSMPNRVRSQTVGSQEGAESPREAFIPGHHKRRSQLFAQDISPSSSDNEGPQSKALYKVQRRRQSSRRMSQITLMDGPVYRPLDVLICEDHPVSKMVMERLFEKLRCRTITASTGSEAMRLAVSQIQFDIIFMEYRLPSINGVDVARMVRDTKNANTQTPIVAVTGYLKELPENHQFASLVQKPPTLTKLTEALCKFCTWKPPPKDFKPSMPLSIPRSNLRQESQPMQDSPTSTASTAPTMPDSSCKGSSREDSVSSSSFFGDTESAKGEPGAFILRRPTDEWSVKGGLGISEDIVVEKKPYVMSGFPHLVHTESAPAAPDSMPLAGVRTPRRQKSQEGLKVRRVSYEGRRYEQGAEFGDDEDEELGDVQVRARSPQGKQVRQASKLGHEMMRTNSRGSVISTIEDGKAADIDASRSSIEILEQRMEDLKIPEEPEALPSAAVSLAAAQPRKLERTGSYHAHPEPGLVFEGRRPPSQGHITPPIIFPRQPGVEIKEFEMGAGVDGGGDGSLDGDVTPMPRRTLDFEEQPTPRPQGSPSHRPERV
jgi:serine/threonine-protein kinase RIM15